ncbi:hypothetical protein BH09PAT1_BH09PAT1_7270 [soil metagenome]
MPIYQYKCTKEKTDCSKCHAIFEKSRPVKERNDVIFCECGVEMQRVNELTGKPIFKGDGFTPKFHS